MPPGEFQCQPTMRLPLAELASGRKQRTRQNEPERRRACLWSVDVGGDQTDTSRGNLRLNLNGMVMSLNELMNVLERAIHLLAIQKFQSERLIELCLLEADKASACVLGPMEVKIRNATAGHEKEIWTTIQLKDVEQMTTMLPFLRFVGAFCLRLLYVASTQDHRFATATDSQWLWTLLSTVSIRIRNLLN